MVPAPRPSAHAPRKHALTGSTPATRVWLTTFVAVPCMTRILLTGRALAAACVAWAALAPAAMALTACSAADISAQDAGCPSGTGPCAITKDFTVGDGCTLDFGARDVTLTRTLDIGSGTVTLRARALTLTPSGFIDGRGNELGSAIDTGGGSIIETSGAVTLEKGAKGAARIDVSGNSDAGNIEITAGGPVTIAGHLNANQLTTAASGGGITITSRADVLTESGSEISATGGRDSTGGGDIDITADGNITLNDLVDVSGGTDGGAVTLTALGRVSTSRVTANGTSTGDAGSGGFITVTAGTALDVADDITANGTTSSFGGGSGGSIALEAQYGDLRVLRNILAIGAEPDGDGGDIDATATGNVIIGTVGQTGQPRLSVRGNGTEGAGGIVAMETDGAITTQGPIDASGGSQGGTVDLEAAANITLVDVVDVSGRAAASSGGQLLADAGRTAGATLVVSRRVDARGGVGGAGGRTDLTACQLRIDGEVHAESTTGGENVLTARTGLTILGKVVAAATAGRNVLVFPDGTAPSLGSAAVVSPAATLDERPACTATSPVNCVMPCPACGNGVVEFPETCDDGQPLPSNCDGCSATCQIETCDDGLFCTTDTCDPTLGCRSRPAVTPCVEPPTPTPTATRTPTPSPTATLTPPPTPTVPPTRRPTRTPTLTPTVPPTETPTEGPGDLGDNNCDGRTTAADVSTTLAALGQTPDSPCPRADINGDGVVDEFDITFTILATFGEFE